MLNPKSMNWKPIPQEAPANDPGKKTHISAKFLGNNPSKKSNHPSISYRLFQRVSFMLLNFVKKERKYSYKEIQSLITDLQSITSKLQQKKFFLMEKEMNKKSRILNPPLNSKKDKHSQNNKKKNS